MHSGHHTCESFAFVGYDSFEKSAHTKYGARPADYEGMKEDLAWRMVRGLEKRIPGLSKHIVYYSLGTPLTNEHYLNATRGNLYGIASAPPRSAPGPSRRAPTSTACICAARAHSVTAWQALRSPASKRRRLYSIAGQAIS